MDQSNVQSVRTLLEAFEHRDLETIRAVCDPLIEFLPVTAELANDGKAYQGHDGLMQYMADVAHWWDHLRVEPESFAEPAPDVVLALGNVQGRPRGGDLVVDPASWVCRFRSGLLAYVRVYSGHEAGIAAAASLAS